jgi:hypothetical protein
MKKAKPKRKTKVQETWGVFAHAHFEPAPKPPAKKRKVAKRRKK